MAAISAEFRLVIRPDKLLALPDTWEGMRQDLIDAAKTRVRVKVKQRFRLIKQKFSFQKNPAAWPGQELLQDQCAGSADESVPGPLTFTLNSMTRGLVI